MLIEHEVGIGVPIEVLEGVLMARFRDVEALGESIYRHGEELRSKVGPDGPIAKEVVMDLGRPRISHSGLAIPITWRATGAGLLFPRLAGEIEIRRTSARRSSLRIQASYDPPFGWIGDVLDRLLLERIARLTVVGWLERVAAQLESGVGDGIETITDGNGYLHDGANARQ